MTGIQESGTDMLRFLIFLFLDLERKLKEPLIF